MTVPPTLILQVGEMRMEIRGYLFKAAWQRTIEIKSACFLISLRDVGGVRASGDLCLRLSRTASWEVQCAKHLAQYLVQSGLFKPIISLPPLLGERVLCLHSWDRQIKLQLLQGATPSPSLSPSPHTDRVLKL